MFMSLDKLVHVGRDILNYNCSKIAAVLSVMYLMCYLVTGRASDSLLLSFHSLITRKSGIETQIPTQETTHPSDGYAFEWGCWFGGVS